MGRAHVHSKVLGWTMSHRAIRCWGFQIVGARGFVVYSEDGFSEWWEAMNAALVVHAYVSIVEGTGRVLRPWSELADWSEFADEAAL